MYFGENNYFLNWQKRSSKLGKTLVWIEIGGVFSGVFHHIKTRRIISNSGSLNDSREGLLITTEF
jgi:hypothetical protein